MEGFGRGFEAEALAGSTVEFGGDLVEQPGPVEGKIAAFGEVLTQQPVGVLVRATLPGTVRVAEVDRHAGRGSDLGV